MLEKYFHKIEIKSTESFAQFVFIINITDARVTSKRLIRDEFLRKVTVFWLIVN